VTDAIALAVYAGVIAAASTFVWRRPLWALYAFAVGLALHNAVLAALYSAGVRGGRLTVIQSWKEILLAVALGRVAVDSFRSRRLPYRPAVVDGLGIAFVVLCVAYALIPQSVLGGLASRHAVALALRHNVVPVAAFILFRSVRASSEELRRIAWTLLAVAAAVAGAGLVDVYLVPIGWWRTNGVIDYFHNQLGYDYHGTSEHPARAGLPPYVIYNPGSDEPFLRRLVSTFLSPLGSSYRMVVALLVAPCRRRVGIALAVVAFAGLLFTFSRAALVALAAGLLVWAAVRRRPWPAAGAVAVLAVAIAWAHVFPQIGPTGNWTKADLVYQHERAKRVGTGAFGSALSPNEPSLTAHWTSLREGVRTVLHHPQGYGLGNAGQTASRTGTPVKAGESNYTELGAETGLLGAVLWTAWCLAMLWGLWRGGAARAAAAFAAILALAIQSDVIGDPWVAYCVWGFAGLVLRNSAKSGDCCGEETVP
jgi:hypothetical protein